jgi:ABC-type sugar transport system substrate-binding protein
MGVQDAAKKAGLKFLSSNSDNKLEKEAQLIDTYITQGVKAIVLVPISKTGSVAAIKRATDKGIIVVCAGTTVDSKLPVSQISQSSYSITTQEGKAAYDVLKKLGNGKKLKIATVAFKSQVPEQSAERVNGFLEQVSDLVEVVAEQDAWLAEMSLKVTGDILTANPDLQVIFAANEGGTVGAVQAVRNAGKAGKVLVFGYDTSIQMCNDLLNKDNILQSLGAQSPYDVGQAAFADAFKAIKGTKVNAETILPGSVLVRSDPAGVKAYIELLKKFQ